MTHANFMLKRVPPRRGIALIWTAIFGMVFVGLVALAGDTAYVYLVGQQLQSAADAAALAGALVVRSGDAAARTAATNTAAANYAGGLSVQLAANTSNDAAGDVVVGTYDSTNGFTATTINPNAVKVLTRRTAGSPAGALPLFFSPLFGINTSNVSRSAIAKAGEGVGAGLILLGTTGTDLSVNNADLSVASTNGGGGSIWVNSDGTGRDIAVDVKSNSTMTASDVYVHGGSASAQLPGTCGGCGGCGQTLHTCADVMADPLGGLPAPSTAGLAVHSSTCTTGGTLTPGWYQKGIKVKNATLTLGPNADGSPGVYYIGNGTDTTGLDITNSTLVAHNAIIYLASGDIKMPSGSMSLDAPTSGPFAGVSFFQARTNLAAATLVGSANMTLNGTLYLPNSDVTISGNGTVRSTGNQLIVQSLTMSNGSFNLTYNDATAFKAPGNKPYLVK